MAYRMGFGALDKGAGLPDGAAPRIGSRTTANVTLRTRDLLTVQRQGRAITSQEAAVASLATGGQREAAKSAMVQAKAGGAEAPLVSAFGLDLATAGGGSADPAVARCQCLAGKVVDGLDAEQQAAVAAAPQVMQQFVAQCVADESAVFATMAQNGVAVDGCRAWYMRRTTWMVGGAAVVGLLVFKFLR